MGLRVIWTILRSGAPKTDGDMMDFLGSRSKEDFFFILKQTRCPMPPKKRITKQTSSLGLTGNCTTCKAVIPVDSGFCGNCGAKQLGLPTLLLTYAPGSTDFRGVF